MSDYAAFISYSRRTKRDFWLAHRLHDLLEAYRLPKALVRRAPERRVGKVFIDDRELSASWSLTDELRSALNRSSYLIVVCSPSAAASPYVRNEVEYFLSRGTGLERVLAVISEGEPPAVFPAPLKDPLATDLRIARRYRRLPQEEILRLIAPLVGSSYALLKDRDAARSATRARTIVCLLTLFALVAGTAGYQWLSAAQQRQRAAERLNDVVAVAELIQNTADRKLRPVSGTLMVRDELLRAAAEMLDKVRRSDGDSSNVAVLRARSVNLTSIGDIARARGDLRDAQAKYEAALALDEELLRLDPDIPWRHADLSTSHAKLADLALRSGDMTAMLRHAQASKKHAEHSRQQRPDDPERAFKLAAAEGLVGTHALLTGNVDVARTAFRRRLSLMRIAVRMNKEDPRIATGVAATQLHLAEVELLAQSFRAAASFATEALREYGRFAEIWPGNRAIRHGLYTAHFILGMASGGLNDYAVALDQMERASVLVEEQFLRERGDQEVRTQVGLVNFHLALVEFRVGKRERALTSSNRACDLSAGSTDPRLEALRNFCLARPR